MLLAHARAIIIASYVFCHYQALSLHWHRILLVCFYIQFFLQSGTSYFSSSDWSIFCLPTWPSSCNSPRKCTPVKYKARQKAGFSMVHSKTIYEWYTDDRRVHTSGIRMTHEYIPVTYGRHTSRYEWHTDDIQVHTRDIPLHSSTYEWHMNDRLVHTSDIRMVYEYIRVIQGCHTSTYGWHTSTYGWHASLFFFGNLFNLGFK